jgi:hypothetical protein
MTFRSGTPLPFDPTMRLPSSSTSVRVVPRPRRSRYACPSAVPFDVPVYEGTNWGQRLSVDSTVADPVWAKASDGTVTIGLADTKSERDRRVPVTTISSSCASSATTAVAQQAAVTARQE